MGSTHVFRRYPTPPTHCIVGEELLDGDGSHAYACVVLRLIPSLTGKYQQTTDHPNAYSSSVCTCNGHVTPTARLSQWSMILRLPPLAREKRCSAQTSPRPKQVWAPCRRCSASISAAAGDTNICMYATDSSIYSQGDCYMYCDELMCSTPVKGARFQFHENRKRRWH